MPEYLAPGVYVEEVSYSAPTIEGVGTTTTGFAGPTLTGPVGGMPYGGLLHSGSAVAGSPSGGVPQLLTSFGDFQNIYGGFANLSLKTSAPLAAKNINYMAMAVQAFFTNGGSMLYVSAYCMRIIQEARGERSIPALLRLVHPRRRMW